MSTSNSTIGKRIASARKNAGLTQAALAEMIGISEKYLSRIECGKQSPNIMVIVRICESLCVSADELLLTKTIASDDTNDMLEAIIKIEIEKFSPNEKEHIISIIQAIIAIKNEDIAPIEGHSFGTWSKYDESRHSHSCECGEVEYEDHAWDEGTITVEPSYTTTGLMTYTCEDCSASTTDVIPTLEIPEDAPYIVVDSKNAVIGNTMTIKISLQNNPGITSMRINVEYDGSLMTLTEVEYNTAMGGQSVLPENIEALNGNIVLYWADGFLNYEGDDTFVTLTFDVSDDAVVNETTTISVTYDAEDIYDADESNVTFFCEDGVTTFIDYIPGDISGDGVLNSKDTTRLMRYLAGWDVEVNEEALDVNGDGVVNTKDTTRLMRYLAGWDVEIY